MPVVDDQLDRDLAGLDRLDVPERRGSRWRRRCWSGLWPKVVALVAVVTAWQMLVWLGWRPPEVLPPPQAVGSRLWSDLATAELWEAVARTMSRAAIGFAIALLIGGAVGLMMAQVPVVRVAIGSVVAGLQSMPSVTWFPLALILFPLGEAAIMFVVVMGAAPSIASGLVAGIDGVPPGMHRVAATLGLGRVARYRDVIVPAALPAVLAGLKQGWAFSWRGLMAGELLVAVQGSPSLGSRLQAAREASDVTGLLAVMVVVLFIGVLVDSWLFTRAERSCLRRRGLLVES